MKNLNLYLEKTIKIFIPVLYFLIAVTFYLRTYDSCMIKITLTQFGGAILAYLFIIKLFEEKNIQFIKKNLVVVLPLLFSLCSILVSHFLVSPLKYASGMELIRRLVYIAVTITVIYEFNTHEKFRRLFRWLFFALFVATTYGVIQHLDRIFFPGGMGAPGLDPFIWRGAFGCRIFSTFGNPNFYGDFLVVIGPMTLAYFLKTKNLFYLFLFGLTTFNVVYTYSKGAWIGYVNAFVSFCILTLIFFPKFRTPQIKTAVAIIIIIVVLGAAGAVWFYSTQRTDSIKFRIYTWLSCWEMINTRPLLGTGIGTFYVTYPAWRRPQIFCIEGKHNTQSDHPENEYLEVWFDEGFVGFGIFLWLLATTIISGLMSLKTFSEIKIQKGNSLVSADDWRAYYMLGLLSGLLGMLSHNFVCVSLRFVSSGVFLWLFLGLINSLTVNREFPVSTSSPLKIKDITLTAIIIVFWAIVFRIWTIGMHIIIPYFICIFVIGLLIERNLVYENERVIKLTPSKSSKLNLLFYIPLTVILLIGLRIFTGFFYADIHHNIAIFHSKRAEWDQALTNYTIVHKYNPGFIMAHYFRGNVYNDRFNLTLTHRPEWGDRLIPESKVEEFKKKYELDIKLGNRDVRYCSEEKIYKEFRNDAQRALDAYDDVKRLAPNYVQMHHQRGLLYLKLGDRMREINDVEKANYYYNQALHYFKRYQTIDPIFPINYYRMAYVYLRLGDMENAKKTYEAHLNIPNIFKRREHYVAPEHWTGRRNHELIDTALQYGNLLYMNNEIDKAKEVYELAKEKFGGSSDPRILKNLAILYDRLGKREKIADIAEELIKVAPHDHEARQLFEIYEKGFEKKK